MCGKKKREPPPHNLDLLNADAKALCLRPDPELVKVFGIPQRRRSVESCPSAAAKMPRTVNGTGHTGPSEFCATSI